MVSPLTYRKSDPNKKGRGPGYYYKRNSYKRGWFSKYEPLRDAHHPVNKTTNVSGKYFHAGDLKKTRSKVRMNVGKNRRKKTFMGLF